MADRNSALLRRVGGIARAWSLVAGYAWHVGLRRRPLVVVERADGIGDVICLLGSLPALRARHPRAWLVMVTRADYCGLVALCGRIDAAEWDGFFHRFVRGRCARPRCTAQRSAPRYYWPRLSDECQPPTGRRLHLADAFAAAMAVAADYASLRLRIPEAVRRAMAERVHAVNPDGRPVVVLHPGPSLPVKEWPAEHWAAFGDTAAAIGALMIRVGVAGDSRGAGRAAPRIPHTVDWTGRLTLVELAALLEQAAVFVGIESGPLHIATVIGVPTVALCGPTAAQLHAHPRAPISPVAAIALGCLGCHHDPGGPRHWGDGCPNDVACMRAITPEQATAALAERLGGKSHLPQASR
jgi:ADP-heptose:LPS heptosyltransferase